MSTFTRRGGYGDLGIAFTGVGQVRAKLKSFEFSGSDLAACITPELYKLETESKKRTPWKTGNLFKSHRVIEPTFSKTTGGQTSEGRVVNDADYSFFVHEIPANHPNGGEDHFLLNAATALSKGSARRIAAAVKRRIR